MSFKLPASSAVDVPYEDDTADLASNNSAQNGSDREEDNRELEGWDDWIEEERPCKSLFDDQILPSATRAVEYDRETHGFDVLQVSSQLGLDFHKRTRLINYIRKGSVPAANLKDLSPEDPLFSNDSFLKPVIEDDPLLQLQSDDWSDSDADDAPVGTEKSAPKGKRQASIGIDRKVRRLEEQLRQAKKDFIDLQNLFKEKLDLVEDTPVDGPSKRDDDSHYFESYAYNDIHQTMIQDSIRTSSYARFILSNPLIFNGAVVLDVGCGTGILSLFAAKAGAKRVFAIEASEIAKKAEQIVKDNGMENVITVIRSKVEDLTSLPDGFTHVDVIISEWMGYCCIYESMLDSVLVARDRFLRKDSPTSESSLLISSPKPATTELKDDQLSATSSPPPVHPSPLMGGLELDRSGPGLMAPSQCRMMFGLVEANDLIRERVKFWHDVYGFKMCAMAEEIYDDAVIDVLGPETIMGDVCTIKDLPLQHINIRALDFTSPFKLTTTRSGELNAFVVYFDTFFTTDGKDVKPDAEVEKTKGEFVFGDIMRLGDGGSRRQSMDITKSGVHASPTPQTMTLDPSAPPAPPPPPAVQATAPVPASTSPLKRPSLSARRTSRRNSNSLGLPRPVSFSTGPMSTPTHWKQTVFLLRNPIKVRKDTTVTGSFHCRKSETNSRELDVEIHYLVEGPTVLPAGAPQSFVSQAGETIVQIFKVR